MTQEEAVLALTITPHATVHLATEAPTHIATDGTPHTVDPHPLEASPESAADQGHVHHTNATTEHQQDPLTAPGWMDSKTMDRKHKQVTIDDPPSENYSSDEQASYSEDDLN